VAYHWAKSLGGEEGAALLTKFGLIEQAVEYAIESGAFAHAFELTRSSMKHKLPEVSSRGGSTRRYSQNKFYFIFV
jgi:intraflagellar transport protein 172